MPKATRAVTTIAGSSISSKKSESHPLITIALFCGVGLLATLVAIQLGMELAF